MTARPPTPLKPLLRRGTADRSTWWTRALGSPPALHGEHVVSVGGASYRQWETARSKLAAAIAKGWSGPLPASGERWLYLGAASGTTASHVADLVGESGSVFGVEKSPRPFLRLLQAAERYPNLFPVLADARTPEA
ncbi:MAG TPA: fibrillarin-like rRNA/tRNA 2'-O-methyltransferase, partial [Thermoplasmata archaeon]|nr:fibrillarin-like rRNA/tRNA 2'-O-methyltransferase [Thermoplasmata archaeon]